MIHNMNSPVDYRRLAHHTRGLYFLTPDRTALLHKAFLECGEDSAVAGGGVGNPGPVNLDVAMGRTLHVPQALGGWLFVEVNSVPTWVVCVYACVWYRWWGCSSVERVSGSLLLGAVPCVVV